MRWTWIPLENQTRKMEKATKDVEAELRPSLRMVRAWVAQTASWA